MVGVSAPNLSVSYAYDADGVRVSKTVNGVTTEYLVDNNRDYAQVLEERVNEALTASYIYGLDLISQEMGNADSYYLVDGLGSTRGLTDASGVVTDTYAYDAFGNSIASAGGTANNYLFAGEQFDPSLGDYYLRQRYYNPGVGRFTRRDTYEGSFEYPITLHKYLYGNANPVNGTDPTGLYTLAEAQAVNSILDELASQQINIGSQIINEIGGDNNSLVQFLNQISAAQDFFYIALGAIQIGKIRLPQGDRPSTKYQKHVTGKDYEEAWTLDTGRRINVDANTEGYLVEVKWTGKNDRAWENSPYNPKSRYYNEQKYLDQAERYLKLNDEVKGKGVKYTFSNEAASQHYEQLFRREFPEQIANGTIQVLHVPGNGM